jgi:hypothetical protein
MSEAGGSIQDAKKKELRPHLVKGWVIPPEASARFVWRMVEVLDLHTTPKTQNGPSCVSVLYWRVVLRKYASGELP